MVYGLDSAKGWFRTTRDTRLRSEERSRESRMKLLTFTPLTCGFESLTKRGHTAPWSLDPHSRLMVTSCQHIVNDSG